MGDPIIGAGQPGILEQTRKKRAPAPATPSAASAKPILVVRNARDRLIEAGYAEEDIPRLEQRYDLTNRDTVDLLVQSGRESRAKALAGIHPEEASVPVPQGAGLPSFDIMGVPFPGAASTKPLQAVAAEPLTWTAEQLSHLQSQLYSSGYLDRLPRGGTYDVATASAYADALRDAYYQHKTVADILAVVAHPEISALQARGAALATDTRGLAEQVANEGDYRSQLTTIYEKRWGVPPPPGEIDKAEQQGINLFEYDYQQKQNPAYHQTKDYQDNRLGIEGAFARRLGVV